MEICDSLFHYCQGFQKMNMRKSIFWSILLLYVSFEAAGGSCTLESMWPETIIECRAIKNADLQMNLTGLLKANQGNPSEENALCVFPPHVIYLTLVGIKFETFFIKLGIDWLNVQIPMIYLKISDMNVVSIEADAFNSEYFVDLEELHLENLAIRRLSEGIFNGLSKLKTLIIKRVKLYSFQKNLLEPTESLQKIVIQNCGQQKINVENLFETATTLTEVEVDNCCLSDTINTPTFKGLHSVKKLNLTNNQIEKIGPKSFDVPLETLKFLNLKQNKLKMIPEDLFNVKHSLRLIVNLAQNSWYCDCSLKYELRFLKGVADLIECETPFEFKGLSLSECSIDCNEIPVEEIRKQTSTISTQPPPPPKTIDKIELQDEVESINEDAENDDVDDVDDVNNDIINTIPSRVFPPEDACVIHCELSKTLHPFRWKKDLYITKRLHHTNVKTRYARRIHKQPKVKPGSKIIKFKSNGRDANKFLGCLSTDDMTLVFNKSKLAASNTYQFCWLHSGLKQIIPLDCISFHTFPRKRNRFEKDIWLRVRDKPLLIGLSVLGAFLGIFVGLLISVILAIVFPVGIRNLKMEVEYISPTQREIEAMNRFRRTDMAFRRRFSSKRLQRPSTELANHSAMFKNFDAEGTYITFDVPPPVPPRIITSSSEIVETEAEYFECIG